MKVKDKLIIIHLSDGRRFTIPDIWYSAAECWEWDCLVDKMTQKDVYRVTYDLAINTTQITWAERVEVDE